MGDIIFPEKILRSNEFNVLSKNTTLDRVLPLVSTIKEKPMTVSQQHKFCIRIANLTEMIEQSGLRLKVGTDFLEYRNLRREFTPNRPLYPMFDAASSYVGPENAFWIGLFDDNDVLVHTQALRFLDFGQDTLKTHLTKHHMKYITPGITRHPDTCTFSAAKGLDKIQGRVCYKGEFWLDSDYSSLRGTGMVALLSRLSFEHALEAWQPDYQWALIEAKHGVTGLHGRYGYMNAAPGEWLDADGSVIAEEWLLWMSNEDMRALSKTPIESVPSILDEQAERRRSIAVLSTVAK